MGCTEGWHEFMCEGKAWTVARRGGARRGAVPERSGLCFRGGGQTRFLIFTRGALPSDRELHSMSEEVLCVLLRRATVDEA
jgi:hypothetical protein